MSTPAPATGPLPAPPSDSLLAWVIQHPAEVAAYLATVRALGRLEVIVTQSGATKKFPVLFSGENAVVSLNL